MNINSQHRGKRLSFIKNVLSLLILLTLLVLMALLNIGVGSVRLSVSEVIAAFGAHADPDHQVIVLDYRLVRTLLGMMVGAALAVAGVVAQAILYNPLASPGTLGITAGSGVGAVMIVMLVPQAATGLLSAAAFTGGVLAAAVIYLVAYRDGVDAIRLALVGVAVSALCGAGMNLLLVSGDANLSTALVWLAGSLWGRDWTQFYSLVPWVAVLIPVTWSKYRGVSWIKKRKKWAAVAFGKFLGYFDNEIDAAVEYDQYVLELKGDTFPHFNFLASNLPEQPKTSKYRGVSWSKQTKKWKAMAFGKHLGNFDKEMDAAITYDEYAVKLKGLGNCILNFRENYPPS